MLIYRRAAVPYSNQHVRILQSLVLSRLVKDKRATRYGYQQHAEGHAEGRAEVPLSLFCEKLLLPMKLPKLTSPARVN